MRARVKQVRHMHARTHARTLARSHARTLAGTQTYKQARTLANTHAHELTNSHVYPRYSRLQTRMQGSSVALPLTGLPLVAGMPPLVLIRV